MNRKKHLAIVPLVAAAMAGPIGASTPASATDHGAHSAALPDGCDPSGVTLTTKYLSVGESAMATGKAIMEERHPGLTVEEGVSSAAAYDELTQQVVADIAGGRDIDVVMSGNSQVRFYVDTFAPEPFDPSSLRDTYDQRFLDVGTVNGEVYMAPFQVSFPALFYNIDLMEEAGLDPAAPPTNFTELFDAAVALKDVSAAGAFYAPIDGIADWISQSAIQSAGGVFVNPDGTPGFDTAEGRAGLAIYGEAAANGVIDAVSSGEGLTAFTTGATPLFITTVAQTAAIAGAIGDGFAWGIVGMPVADGGSPNYPAGGNGWLVLTDDPCKAAIASELIGELLDPEIIAEALQTSSYVPVDTAAREILLNLPDIPEQQMLGYMYEGPVSPWGGWPGDAAPEANQIVTDMVQEIVNGADVDGAVTEAVARINDVVAG